MLQIFTKLREWWRPPPTPIAGPRRVKHYAAQTGFQYQYRLESTEPGEYRFTLWTAGRPASPIHFTVPIPGLAARDCYALAKLNLFRLLDEHPPDDLPATAKITDTAALDEL